MLLLSFFRERNKNPESLSKFSFHMVTKTEIQCLPGPVPLLDYVPEIMSLPPPPMAQLLGGTEGIKENTMTPGIS